LNRLCNWIFWNVDHLVLVDRLSAPAYGMAAIDGLLEEEIRFGDFIRLYRTTASCEDARS